MASDLKIDIDNVRLNIRVGLITRYNSEVLIEISKAGANSTVPGGRVKIGETFLEAIKREAKEEMNFELDISKAKMLKVLENFFNIDGKDFHEIYFLYEYILNEKEYEDLQNVGDNKDNDTTYFTFISKFDTKKYNVLPLTLCKEIEK